MENVQKIKSFEEIGLAFCVITLFSNFLNEFVGSPGDRCLENLLRNLGPLPEEIPIEENVRRIMFPDEEELG